MTLTQPDRRCALELLVSGPDGCSEAIMLAPNYKLIELHPISQKPGLRTTGYRNREAQSAGILIGVSRLLACAQQLRDT